MNSYKKQIFMGVMFGMVFLSTTVVFYSRGSKWLTLFFLANSLIDFSSAIYYIVKFKKQGIELEE